MMQSNLKEQQSNNIDEIINEMDNKVRQSHKFMTQQQRQQHQTLEKVQYVKPAKDSSPHSVDKPEIIGRRPVYYPTPTNKEIENIFCLDVLPTEDGNDSLLHCLFGQVNSNGKYECIDTERLCKQIAKYIREKCCDWETYNAVIMFVLRVKDDERFPIAKTEGKKLIDFIMEKHPQLKGTETEMSRWLNQNDDVENEPTKIIDKWKSIWKRNPQIIKYLKEDKNCGKFKILKEECAKYIESFFGFRSTALGLFELGTLLANMFKLTIHVFKEHVSSSSFQHIETHKVDSNDDSRREEHFILYEGKGRWKKLEPNVNLNYFCKDFFTLKENDNKNEMNFEKLKKWISENQEITNKNCIDKFNPKCNKSPDKLSQLVLDWIKPNMDIDEVKQLEKAISLLAKWVDYYNSRNVSPFFYLTIVGKCPQPQELELDFIVLEMETRLNKPDSEMPLTTRENWRKSVRDSLKTHDQALLSLLTQIVMKTRENDFLFSFDLEKLLRMLNVLKQLEIDWSFLDKKDIDSLSIINLFYKNRGTFWWEKVDKWLTNKTNNRLIEENQPEYVNLLLELEYKNQQKLLQDFTNNSAEAIGCLVRTTRGQKCKRETRTVEDIFKEMNRKDIETNLYRTKDEEMVNKSKSNKIQLENCVESIVNGLIKKNSEKYKNYRIFLKEERRNQTLYETCDIKNICELFKNILKKGAVYKIRGEIKNLICDRQIKNTTPLADFLCVFDYAVELIMGFELRDTQRVALMTLLERGEKTLAQVKTGEGKSIIVAGLAIGHALMYKENSTVDVITSNDILAIRDSSLSVAEGGLKELYEFFNVTVANNCSQSIDERKRAYNKDIVYGQLANFQRDYLLDTFYNRNIRGDRPMNFVIIDEADCMLLDRGNDVLYLSHDIPGMEMLESLYVFIWEKIQKIQTVIIGDEELELIKSAILYDLHGQIKREDLKNIQNNLLGQEESALERTALWDHLIREKVIDPKGRLLIHDVNEITENKMNYSVNIGLDSKLKFYFRKIAERERRIRIPNHLSDFVDRNLDTWLDNARRALQLKQDEDYVIDCDRSDTSPDFNLQVIVIDPETGTDQFNSQWDGALHQFLQLKEGCKLTMQSLKAIFISNAKYINFYVYLVGVSGTLGSRTGKIFLKNTYKCDCFTIPTAFPKIFLLKPAKLLKTKESWLTAITKETQRTIVKENRSIVIFCQSIKQVNQLHQHLKSKIPDIIKDPNNKRIHRYTRDYEKFQFEKEPGLDIGNVIVTTNLAGRGTDIKLSETLKANGSLHICLTYFPENERVEEQAMGRAARKGEPGSGILILWEPQIGKDSRADEEWGAEKIFVMKEERAWKEKQRISQIEKDFKHTESFNSDRNVLAEKSVMEQVEKLKKEKTIENEMIQLLDDKALLKFIQGNKLDKWALWLDESDYNLKYFNLNPFFQFENSISADFFTSSTPARKIAIFKCLATTKNKGTRQIDQKEKAKNILNELIHSPENVFYPAAFYYYAFVRLKEGNLDKNGKEEFIRSLRSAETILSEHIDMQISFSLNHQSDKKLADPSFCDVDGYREQKENNIKILQCFISSIQSLLGAHYLTASDIEEKLAELKNKKENAQKSKELIKTQTYMKADKLFKWLMKSKYIECKVNDPDTVPNYNDVIQEIANEYDVKRSTLEKKLSTILGKFQSSAIDIEKEIEKENLILCSKKSFWATLVKAGALIDAEDIIVMDDSECDNGTKLDRSEKMTHSFVIDGYVQYEPKYFSQSDFEKKKIMFTKEYAKDTLPAEEYRRREPKFEFNKIAKINFNKLKTVDLKVLGKLDEDHLRHADFNPIERQVIWKKLKEQGIIDDQGYYIPLAPDFKYSDCPIYEDVVNWLIEKTFPAEFVRRKWLEMKSKDKAIKASSEYLDCIKSINLLPEKPYRQMLGELMASHVISGARVADDIDFEFDVEFDEKKKLKEIIDDKEELNCIKELLKERQADYVATKKDNVTFEFLEGEIKARKDMRNIWSEFHVFRLIGFDCIISIKDRKKSWKTYAKAIGIIVLGGVQWAAGVTIDNIDKIPGIESIFNFNSLIGDLTKTGLDDIYFGIRALKSPNDVVFYYRIQKIKSLKESEGLVLRGVTSLAQYIRKKIKEKKSQS